MTDTAFWLEIFVVVVLLLFVKSSVNLPMTLLALPGKTNVPCLSIRFNWILIINLNWMQMNTDSVVCRDVGWVENCVFALRWRGRAWREFFGGRPSTIRKWNCATVKYPPRHSSLDCHQLADDCDVQWRRESESGPISVTSWLIIS